MIIKQTKGGFFYACADITNVSTEKTKSQTARSARQRRNPGELLQEPVLQELWSAGLGEHQGPDIACYAGGGDRSAAQGQLYGWQKQ
ncbi:hypothetical protein KI810_14575 [Geobacter luticola]|uniref:Uncharacterized protein n=1 Tax=Geomobilimonas luticola TaxID=1114878 RepID=A0ABS5SHS1_9BACT|nr:hypothetical protein [Geomobilimonas luticola]